MIDTQEECLPVKAVNVSWHNKVMHPSSWTRMGMVISVVLGIFLAGGVAYAATNWVAGLNSGSSAESQSATVSNLTIAVESSPAATNLLYPGGTGDAVILITNPNPFPVTITGVDLPTNTTYATGYSDPALTSTNSCTSTVSDVIWNFSSTTSGSVHTLTTPLVVGAYGTANEPLTVTLTNDASMTTSAPAACESTYFAMPAFTGTGIVATGGSGTATTSPATDSWTS